MVDSACYSAVELKAQANEAYKRHDVREAVELWNRALVQHVDDMEAGQSSMPILSDESRRFEQVLYLNLAQGYLKLGEAARALRASQVVLTEDRQNAKARYRAAEACLALQQFDEAAKLLKGIPESEPGYAEAVRLLQEVRGRKALAAKEQKEMAKRMCSGTAGYAGRRDEASDLPHALQQMHGPDATALACSVDIAGAAAQAAREREARLERPGTCLEPTVTDTSSFCQKMLARSQKYTSYMERSKKKREAAGNSLKLHWLRSGRDSAGLDGFVAPLKEELRAIEAELEHELEPPGPEESGGQGS